MSNNFQLSQILALQVEAFAINAEIAGMVADNNQHNYDQPHSKEDFMIKSEQLYGIANAIVMAGRT